MKIFDNYIIICDFNLKPSNTALKNFLDSNELYNLIKEHLIKGKGSLIDLILTNRKISFKNTQSFQIGLSDHHHQMVYTMLKTTFQKSEPKQSIYRDLKNFYFESFKNDLLESKVTCDRSYDEFDGKSTTVLNKHPPKKKKWLRSNEKAHINKNLSH